MPAPATMSNVLAFESLWGAYIARLARLDELKAQGRYGYQLRMPKQACRMAYSQLRAWCDANGVECPA
jgi:hypothetical protein